MNTRRIFRLAGACGLAAASFATQANCGTSGWSARIGAHDIIPSEDTSLAAGKVSVKNKVTPTLNLDYRFCEHLEVDVLGSLPVTHDILLNGSKIGSTQHLPPTVTLRWHPLNASSAVDPYVGVGVNYTMFRNESSSLGSLKLDNTVGVAAAVGIDWNLNKHWLVGVDGRYIKIEPKAHLNGGDLGTVKINPFVAGVTLGYRF